MPDQILTQTGQQLLGGEEAAVQQHVWLAILRTPLQELGTLGRTSSSMIVVQAPLEAVAVAANIPARLPPITMTSRPATVTMALLSSAIVHPSKAPSRDRASRTMGRVAGASGGVGTD
jgi:hypothetical protein